MDPSWQILQLLEDSGFLLSFSFGLKSTLSDGTFQEDIADAADFFSVRGWVSYTSGWIIGRGQATPFAAENFVAWLVFAGPEGAQVQKVVIDATRVQMHFTLPQCFVRLRLPM